MLFSLDVLNYAWQRDYEEYLQGDVKQQTPKHCEFTCFGDSFLDVITA